MEYVTKFLLIFLPARTWSYQLDNKKNTKVRYTIFSFYFGKSNDKVLPKYTYYFVYLVFEINIFLCWGCGKNLSLLIFFVLGCSHKNKTQKKADKLMSTFELFLVSPIGFEPMTASLEGRCSIQLSYEPILVYKMVSFAAANIQIILKKDCFLN